MQALLIQLGVKEVLLAADDKGTDYDLKKIRTLIDRCNIVVTDRKRSAFRPSSLLKSLADDFVLRRLDSQPSS